MPWNNPLPIQAFEQCLELGTVDRDYAVRDARPNKTAAFYPFVNHNQSCAVPNYSLHAVGAFRAKDEDGAAERIKIKFVHHNRGQPIHR